MALVHLVTFGILVVVTKFAIGRIVKETSWWKAFLVTIIIYVIMILISQVLYGAVFDVGNLFGGE